MQSQKFENIIFYLDLTGKLIKKKELSKIVSNFLKVKSSKNPLSNFGLLLFKEDGSPDFISDTKDMGVIVKKIDNDWKNRQVEASFLENGLMYCLSNLASQSAKKSGDNRVIVISDSPSNKSTEYQDALIDLVEIVKFMPTYIDIIRVGEKRFYSDDVKLRIITSTSNGGLFYVENSNKLNGILQALTKNKKKAHLNMPDSPVLIDDTNKLFYENLATDLLTADMGETGACLVCGNDFFEGDNIAHSRLLKCYNCGSLYHEEHIAKYTFEHNIGLPHLFRCLKCDVLLKLNEILVLNINGIEPEPVFSDIIEQETLFEEQMVEEEAVVMNQLELTAIPSEKLQNEVSRQQPSHTRPPPGGFNFFSSPADYENDAVGSNNQVDELWVPPAPSPTVKSITSDELAPPGIRKAKRKKKIRKFVLCQMCGVSNSGFDKVCKNCGAQL